MIWFTVVILEGLDDCCLMLSQQLYTYIGSHGSLCAWLWFI